MDWIVNAWALIEPYVLKGLEWLTETGVGAGIAYLLMRKFYKKHDTETLGEDVSSKVANKLVTKDIKVTLESVNKEQIEKIKKELTETFAGAVEFISLQNDALSAMAKIMIKFKAASEEEKAELIAAINKIECKSNKALTVEEKAEPIIVNIEAVNTAETKDTTTLF